jgi:ribose transport system permease protein
MRVKEVTGRGPRSASPKHPNQSPQTPTITERLFRHPEVGLAILLLAALLFFEVSAHDFLTLTNIRSNLIAASFIGIVAMGQGPLIISGNFDLSVGSTAALAAVTAAELSTHDGLPVPLAILCAIGVGATVGLFNGVLVVRLGLPALIVTLGTYFMAGGLAYVVSGGTQIFPLRQGFNAIAGTALGVPISIWLFAAAAAVTELMLRRSKMGRRVYAVGGNRGAATLAGIRTDALQIGLFVLTGALAAIAGILVMAEIQSGSPEIGSAWQLSVLAAVVLGGTSLKAGVGTCAGMVLGVLFIQVLDSGMVFIHITAALQPSALGIALIAALIFDGLRGRVLTAASQHRT